MFKRSNRRAAAGLMAIAIVLSNVIMPITPAFADDNGTYQPVWCKLTGNDWKAQLAANGNGKDGALLMTQAIKDATLSTVDNSIDIGQQVYAHDRSDKLDDACAAQAIAVPTSIPVPAGVADICGKANDTVPTPTVDDHFTITDDTGWVQDGNDSVKTVRTITYKTTAGYVFTASEGWTLSQDGTEATYTFTDWGTRCSEPAPEQVTAVNGVFTDICGREFNLTFAPADTTGITYNVTQTGNTLTITATAQRGYELTNPEWSQSATDELTACPRIQPCCETQTPITVTDASQFADYQDTRLSGFYGFAPNGLKIWTTDATSQAKVAWYHLYSLPLQDIGTPSIDYTSDFGIAPGMQIALDINNDNVADGIIVGEPDFYGNNWWSNTDFGVGSGMGYASYGTLNDYLMANPNARVLAVGFSLGSGVHASGILHSITFGCQTWNFTMIDQPGEGGGTPTPTPEPKPAPAPAPAELPHTGASLNGVILAIFAGITTYGVVYFAQSKRN